MPPRQSQRIRTRRNTRPPSPTPSSSSEDETPTRSHRPPAKNPWIELSSSDQNKYAKRLTRYILARNNLKMPIKRSELKDALLDGGGGRVHPRITQGALEKVVGYLKGKFGFQVLEVRKFGRGVRGRVGGSEGLEGGPRGEKGFIVVNCVGEGLRAEIGDERLVGLFGFVIVVAAMILLEPGARLGQGKLYKNLNALGLIMSGRVGNNHKDLGCLKEVLEKRLTEQWYFEREKDGPDSYSYLLGPRLLHELSEQHLLAFISAVYQTPLDEASKTELKMRFASMREASDSDSD